MNAVLLSPELFLNEGGIARILRLYLRALCELAGKDGCITSLVLNDHPEHDPRLAGLPMPALRRQAGFGRNKWKFARAVVTAGRDADLVVCGHLHLLPAAWLTKRIFPRRRLFLVAHGIEVWRPYTPVERRALLAADRILCISDYTRRQMLRFCPELDSARLLILPNTFDPTLAPPASPAPQDSGPKPRILSVGRLTRNDTYKGFDTLIEAMPLLRRKQPDASLIIVGGGDDLERLQRLALRLGVGSSVIFRGVISDAELAAEYAACDLFAMPSRKEGFGLVYLEAMVHGKPCLAAAAGGAPEVVIPAVGALAPYGHVAEIAAALNDLVMNPRNPAVIRARAASFAFPVFRQRLGEALAA